MRKIWSSANIRVYGWGVAEDGFLRAISDLIGDYSYTNVSISSGKSGQSRARQKGTLSFQRCRCPYDLLFANRSFQIPSEQHG